VQDVTLVDWLCTMYPAWEKIEVRLSIQSVDSNSSRRNLPCVTYDASCLYNLQALKCCVASSICA